MPRKDAQPEGWTRQALQVPTALAREFQECGAKRGSGEIKNLGTVALAIVAGMPEIVRESMVLWAIQTYRADPNAVTPDTAWRIFLGVLQLYLRADASARKSMESGETDQTRQFRLDLARAIVEVNELATSEGEEIDDRPYMVSSIVGIAVPPLAEVPEDVTKESPRKDDPPAKRRKKK